MQNITYRSVNADLRPRRTRLEIPGWAGEPEPRADGSVGRDRDLNVDRRPTSPAESCIASFAVRRRAAVSRNGTAGARTVIGVGRRVEIAHAQRHGWAKRNRSALMPSRADARAAIAEISAGSPAFAAFRGTEWMVEPCRSCERKNVDFGGCGCQALALALALALTGDGRQAVPVCHLSPSHRRVDEAVMAETEGPAPDYRYRRTPQPPRADGI